MNNRLRIGVLMAVAALVTTSPAVAANNGHGKGQASGAARASASPSASSHGKSATAKGKSATAKGKTVRVEVTLTGTLADTPTATTSPIQVLVKSVPAAARKALDPKLRGHTIEVVVPSLSLVRRNGIVPTVFTDLKSGDHLSIRLKATSAGTPKVWTYTASRVNATGK